MPAPQQRPLPTEPWAAGQDPNGQAQKDWNAQADAYWKEKHANNSLASEPVSINPDNYTVAQPSDYADLARKYDEARDRPGVQIDNRAADASLAQSLAARGRQQEAAGLYGAAAMGIGPSAAQEQMRMALDAQTQHQARQAAIAGGARAINASTPAYGAIGAQGAGARQGEVQHAYQGAGQTLIGMRRSDIGAMRQSQDAAFAQAQLDAAQRARNDALGRAYLGQSNDLSIQQLAANQAYEGQRASDQQGVAGLEEQANRLREEKARRDAGMVVNAAGTLVSAGATGLGRGGG
jgi:hypothetical protein